MSDLANVKQYDNMANIQNILCILFRRRLSDMWKISCLLGLFCQINMEYFERKTSQILVYEANHEVTLKKIDSNDD